MTTRSCPEPDTAEVVELLAAAPVEVVGRLTAASNVTLLVEVGGTSGVRAVYKPVSGERPLWDFPLGTLAGREVAAYLLGVAARTDVVPPTVLREDAPFGPGSLQLWIESEDDEPGAGLVDIHPPQGVPRGWRPVLAATGEGGRPVVLSHADTDALRTVAVLDVALNNADRKGGHLIRGRAGRVHGVDHGLTFHQEDKLRTVLWGWAGEPLRDQDRELLARITGGLDGDLGADLSAHLCRREIAALRRRVDSLLDGLAMPHPHGSWPPVPWPAF